MFISRNDYQKLVNSYKRISGSSIYRLSFINFLANIIESVGILMFIPLFSSRYQATGTNSNNMIVEFVNNLFTFFGVPIGLVSYVAMISILFIAKSIITYKLNVIRYSDRSLISKKIRENLIKDINGINYEYYIKRKAGYFSNLLNDQVSKGTQVFHNFSLAISFSVASVTYFGFASIINFRQGLIMGVLSIFIGLIFISINGKVKIISNKLSNIGNEFNQKITSHFINFHYYKTSGKNLYIERQIDGEIKNISKNQIITGKFLSLSNSLRDPILAIVLLSILLIEIEIYNTDLPQVIVSLALFYKGMSALLASQSFTQGVYEFIGNLNVVLDELELLKSNSEKKYFGKNDLSFNKSIKFKNVNFNYKENQNVGLSDVSLEFDKGRKYFIVGETASGKSTFIKLILGLLRVNSGYIEIDGKNLYSGNIENWRSKIGYVAQDLYIYNDTIMSNITLVDNANAVLRDKAREVSKLVLLDNYFESLDHKYDTNIQDHGASMSGGQRQRIYLAREILKGSEILILDEATSALDSETERIIVENLLNYNSNATIIFISHNTHLSKYFDQTIVFHEGKVTIRD